MTDKPLMTSEPEKLRPVTFEDREAAKALRREIQRQIGPRMGLGTVEDADFDVQLLAKHRLSSPVSGTDMVRDAAQALADRFPHDMPDYAPAYDEVTALRRALSASPTPPIPMIAEAGEREPLLAREIAAQFYDKRDPLDQSYRDVAHNIRRGRLDDQDAVELVRFTLAHQAATTPATLDNTAVEVVPLEAVIALVDAEMNERVTYFERTSGHYDRKQAAGSYRATGEKLVRAIATLTAKTEKAE